MTRQLTEDDKRKGFLRATNRMEGSEKRWQERAATGVTDDHLEQALAYEMGEEGAGSSWGDIPAYYTKRAGLRIWLHWDFASPFGQKPAFKDAGTVAMARAVYGIGDPSKHQPDLFGGAP
jgi:hypothetical protein